MRKIYIYNKKKFKDAVNIYIKKTIKDLNNKTFKYYIYTEHYNIALDFARGLKLKKISSITFNKEPRISKKHLIQKNKKGV